MTRFQTLTLASLEDIGLGPGRIARAAGDENLFGAGGLLNSIELVQFIAALSERSSIDAFELMEGFQGSNGIVMSLSSILAFLENRQAQQVMAG